jgi:hypothetical protein
MHIFRASFLFVLGLAVAGCAGISSTIHQPDQPATPATSQFLYVGTTNGILTFKADADGALQPVATNPDAAALCSPEFFSVPGGIYSLSASCLNPALQTELRRFDLGPGGDIVASVGPFSLGPDLPSSTGSVSTFVTAPAGNLAYVWTIGSDSREYITPVQIGRNGSLTAKPALGISFSLQNTSD